MTMTPYDWMIFGVAIAGYVVILAAILTERRAGAAEPDNPLEVTSKAQAETSKGFFFDRWV
jgi:hypothetical protein